MKTYIATIAQDRCNTSRIYLRDCLDRADALRRVRELIPFGIVAELEGPTEGEGGAR